MANLADLTVEDLSSAINDAELDAQHIHGLAVSVRITALMRENKFWLELAASTRASCVERTVASDGTYFTTRAQVDNYLSALLTMLVRSAVEQMDMAASRP